MEKLILKTIADFFEDESLKNKILESKVYVDKSEAWTYRRDHFNETYVNITVTCYESNVKESLENVNEELVKKLLDIDFGKNYSDVDYYPNLEIKIGAKNRNNNGTTDISFEDFEKIIVENLRKAKFYIWAAVAWVTNPKIVEELNKKALEGLNVQVLLIDDNINNKSYHFKSNINLQVFKIKNFGTSSDNKMHNKFCIIDGKIFINGSNNWSKKAENNNENIMVMTGYEIDIEKYQEEFIRIKKEHGLNI